MREVAIIAYAQTPLVRDCGSKNDVELVMEVVHAVKKQLNFTNKDIDFFCSGSCDYLGGSAFAFVNALDALGAVPPINESHVEMDAAWALIRIDGADTSLLHMVDAGNEAKMKRGMKVKVRWAAERRGFITDIACFEPA